MRFLEGWLPLVVAIRQRQLDPAEMKELEVGFERQFARQTVFAVLSLSDSQAPDMDALARQRLADWGNQPRIQRLSRQLCAGSATVVARDGERRALTALLWLWTPAAPHDVVHSVARGIDFCVSRLLERQVVLPCSVEAFRHQIQQELATSSVAGLQGPAATRRSDRPRQRSGPRRKGGLEKLVVGNGHLVIGWLGPKVLWVSFHGYLSAELAEVYAKHLDRLVRNRPQGIAYFGDASGIASVDLTGRAVALRALSNHQHRFASLRILNWAAGLSGTVQVLRREVGDLPRVFEDPAEFERELLAVAPNARKLISEVTSTDEASGHVRA